MVARAWSWAFWIWILWTGFKSTPSRRSSVHPSRELLVSVLGYWRTPHQVPPNFQRLHWICMDKCPCISKVSNHPSILLYQVKWNYQNDINHSINSHIRKLSLIVFQAVTHVTSQTKKNLSKQAYNKLK